LGRRGYLNGINVGLSRAAFRQASRTPVEQWTCQGLRSGSLGERLSRRTKH
jgi:hypothetical protein